MKIDWANPWLDKSESAELNATFDSTWLGMGPRTVAFEDTMRHYIGVKHAVAVSNGTVALDLALKALGIKPHDEVIVPAMTYIATVSSILYQYATPIFADIERDTYNIDPSSVERHISRKTRCIVYIDYGGIPADYPRLQRIAAKYSIPILQDGAQSLGAEFKGERLCKQGTISTTSFHIAKLMTTVEGGMIFTSDDNLAQDIKMRRNQGEDPQEKYIHRVLGTNARFTDLQAAIGLKQFEKFEVILKRRAEIAEFYYREFGRSKDIIIASPREGSRCAWFFAPILVENRDRVAKELNAAGIATRIAYPMPVFEQPFFKPYRDKKKKYLCPNAKWMTERVINLPMYHALTNDQLFYIVERTMAIVAKHS